MTGVDFGNSVPNEPIEQEIETAHSKPKWFEAMRFYHANFKSNTPTKTRLQRRYKLILHKNGESITQENISQNRVRQIAAEHRKNGFTVDIIEECSLTGEITRHPESTDKIPAPVAYVTNAQKSRSQVIANKMDSLRSLNMSRRNAVLNSRRDQYKAVVYNKETGQLVYSGEIEGAVDFIIENMAENDWVLYVPNTFWRKHFGIVNDT